MPVRRREVDLAEDPVDEFRVATPDSAVVPLRPLVDEPETI
jgi:hypothetical protein